VSRPVEEDFLGRWSARKLKARAEAAREPAPADAPSAEPATEVVAEKTDAEILEELGLPDPESLVKGDDFKAFLRAGVPAQLRARALRRLWLTDPVLANLDGLNDYEQDFTDKATVRPDLKTAYRVGKGFLREAPEAAATESSMGPEAERDISEGSPAEARSAGASPIAEPDAGPSAGAHAGPDSPPAVSHGTELAAGEPADFAHRPSRMRFRFDVG
jgi:hypothetical protein